MNAREITDAIAYGNFSSVDLQGFLQAIKIRQSYMVQEKAVGLGRGVKVRFQSRKVGVVEGTVLKVNRKNAVVLSNTNSRWRVPMHMLEQVR